MRKRLFLLLLFCGAIATMQAQFRPKANNNKIADITASFEIDDSEKSGTLRVNFEPMKGWHIYGVETGEYGPKPLSFDFSVSEDIQIVGNPEFSPEPVVGYDENFDMQLPWWSEPFQAEWRFEICGDSPKIGLNIQYQGCNDIICSPPQRFNYNTMINN